MPEQIFSRTDRCCLHLNYLQQKATVLVSDCLLAVINRSPDAVSWCEPLYNSNTCSLVHSLACRFRFVVKNTNCTVFHCLYSYWQHNYDIICWTPKLVEQMPKSLRLNSELFSSYKNHTTIKGLIGISPGDAITFVSQLYTGHISDREIVMRSGFLNLPSSQCKFSQPFKKKMIEWCSKKWLFNSAPQCSQ